jgi:endonuclease/exonuclease/phosphatase family metal-dependent hydrolase
MRLASFNLLHGMSVIDGRVDAGRLTDAVASLDVDVLALQEVDRNQDRSARLDLTALAAAALGADGGNARFVPALLGTPGLSWRPAAASDDGDGGDSGTEPAYGISLVSRWPVQAWRTIPLGSSPVRLPVLIEGPRRRVLLVKDEPRVALAAVLGTDAPIATVVSTHLSFAPGWNLVQLARLTRAVRMLPHPIVLLGDLNLPGRAAAVLPGWHSLGRLPTYPAGRPRVQLDHALVRSRGGSPPPPVRSVAAVRTGISDHRALVVDLETEHPGLNTLV